MCLQLSITYPHIRNLPPRLAGVLPTQALVGQPKSTIVGQNGQTRKSPTQIRFSNQPTLMTNTAQLLSGNQALLNHIQVSVSQCLSVRLAVCPSLSVCLYVCMSDHLCLSVPSVSLTLSPSLPPPSSLFSRKM